MEQTQSELANFIVAEVARQSSEANVRKLVETKIGECIKHSVDTAFRSYGDIGKQIEKAVSEALSIREPLDLPSHSNMVLALLRTTMDGIVSELVKDRLNAEMADILQIAPKEIKLSTIVQKMVDGLDSHDRYGSRVTCLVESDIQSYFSIALDEDDRTKRYECAVRLGVTSEGNIYHLSIDDLDVKKAVLLGYMPEWKKMIFSAYCCGSKLIVDADHCSTGVGDF